MLLGWDLLGRERESMYDLDKKDKLRKRTMPVITTPKALRDRPGDEGSDA